MCGIFGIALRSQAKFSRKTVQQLLERLYVLSESRGKESAGLHISVVDSRETFIVKSAISASDMLKSADYRNTLLSALSSIYQKHDGLTAQAFIITAHSRLVTDGRAEKPENNQPVRCDDVIMVHNGIVVNANALWHAHTELQRKAEVDTEILAAIIDQRMALCLDPILATRTAYQALQGAASIAWTHAKTASLALATNTGDLYFAHLPSDVGIIFASEQYILEQTLKHQALTAPVQNLSAGQGIVLDMQRSTSPQIFDLFTEDTSTAMVVEALPSASLTERTKLPSADRHAGVKQVAADEGLLQYNEASMRALRRCSRCILPETFPFITFDDEGVCNYCHGYQPKYKGLSANAAQQQFLAKLEKYRSKDGSPDVLVPFSGGRDSCYGLHLIKKEFGLNPITFTYDWGMVTDLARRNIARLCGALGVQNILVSADLKAKRDNVRKNVAAWLKKPDLGMVPLFMAGDKHFFKIVNALKRQTGIRLDLWSANPLENTDFKSGFCGVTPDFDKARLDYLSMTRKLKMAAYYAHRFVVNPAYINRSLLDTAQAFFSYYLEPRRDFFFMFNDLVWNEDVVNDTITTQYDFERSPDSPSTWRIGDGTAPFYNYIYMTARGFTEFDTFRSNQIREGHIARDVALERVLEENRPRTESLRWYLDTIGLDFNSTILAINALDMFGRDR